MELETKLPVSDREARRVIEDNFRKIQETLGKLQTQVDDLSKQVDDLSKSGTNTEYITDTNVATDYTTDAPTSVEIDDTNGDDEIQGLTIQEGGK